MARRKLFKTRSCVFIRSGSKLVQFASSERRVFTTAVSKDVYDGIIAERDRMNVPPYSTTLRDIVESALRRELARLRGAHPSAEAPQFLPHPDLMAGLGEVHVRRVKSGTVELGINGDDDNA